MKEQDENLTTSTGLPENAFRELAADEQFTPVMHPAHDQQEATPYSVGMGLLMAVIFSAAAAYLGLKVGQQPSLSPSSRWASPTPSARRTRWGRT